MVTTVLKYATMAIVFMLVMGYVVMFLWNWIMPDLLGLPLLTFWKALGLLLLAKLLFGFGGGHDKGHWKGKKESFWKERMKDKMAGMSEEERVKYRAKMSECWQKYLDEEQCQESVESGNASL